jgi:hypothetical protein
MTITQKNPKWWTNEHESSWDRVKAAIKRDWDQTKHDVGAKKPDTNQNVKDTVKQAAGKESIPPRGQPVYDDVEPAYRFGYGARSYYGRRYPKWDNNLESELRRDWSETYPDDDWDTQARYIRSGWDYKQ